MDEERDQALEALLNRYRPRGPDAVLRVRIVRESQRRSRWVFVEGLAALLLVGMTLAQIGGTVTRLIPNGPVDGERTQKLATEIAALDLPFDKVQTEVMAQELVAGERLVRLPQVYAAAMNATDLGVLR